YSGQNPVRPARRSGVTCAVRLWRKARHKGGGSLLNDLAAAGEFLFTQGYVLADDGFEVIDVVQVNVFKLLHVGVDVPGHRNIDEKQRAVSPDRHHARNILSTQN